MIVYVLLMQLVQRLLIIVICGLIVNASKVAKLSMCALDISLVGSSRGLQWAVGDRGEMFYLA